MYSTRRANFALHHLGRPWWRSLFTFVLLFTIVTLVGCSGGSGSSSGGGGSTPTPDPTHPTLKSVYIASASATGKEITSLTMYTQEKAELCLMGKYDDGSCSEVSGTWNSSTPAKASVTDGIVTAVAAGKATITATENGGKSATVAVTVEEVTLESISIFDEDGKEVTSSDLELVQNTNMRLSAVGTYSDGETKDVAATWKSADSNIASVDANTGLVKGEKAGTAKITAAVGSKSAYVNENVVYKELKSIQINTEGGTAKKNIGMFVGQDMVFAAKGNFADGDEARLNDISWSASGDAISVGGTSKVQAKALKASNASTEEYGVTTVTASKPGEAKLMAIDTNTGMSTELNVVVTDSDIDSITLVPYGSNGSFNGSIAKGQTVTQGLIALATMDDGQSVNISSVATWTSDSTNVVVTTDGEYSCASLQGVNAGKANISCTYKGVKSKAYAVTVVDVKKITMEDSLKVVCGESAYVSATAILADGSSLYLNGANGTWTTSNSDIAIVYNSRIYGLALGNTTITCKFGGKTASCSVSVVNLSVESITLDPTELTVAEEGEGYIHAYANMSDMTVKLINTEAKWTSDHSDIATVSEGNVIGVKAGEATITCEYGGKKATCAVTVTGQGKVESIALTPDAMTVMPNKSYEYRLTAIATLSDETTRELSSYEVTWKTSDSDVAVVSENAYVYGVGQGTCSIYCEYKEGETAVTSNNCTVTVPEIASVVITPSQLAIVSGLTKYLNAVACLEDGEMVELDGYDVKWSSSDTDVAIVDEQGYVTGVGSGTANITCTYAGVTSSACQVSVKEVVSVNITSAMSITVGQSEQLPEVEIVYSDSTTEQRWAGDCSWYTGDANMAVVREGLVYGISEGETDIWCSYGGVESNTCEVTVTSE